MSEFIILNPSPNMLKLYLYLKNSGKSVKVVENGQFPSSVNNCIYQFYDKTYIKRGVGGGIVEESFLKLKKNIFSGFFLRKRASELKVISPALSSADLIDICLFKGCGLVEKAIPYESVSGSAMQMLAKEHPGSKIITGYMENVQGSEKIVMFDTDFDIKETLGNDYFIFYQKGARLEVCTQGNRLITIGNKKIDHLEFLMEIQPLLKKFVFKKIKELVISRNRHPWISHSNGKDVILINDFSFFNISLKLPDTWAERVGKFICAGKQQ